MNVNPTLSALRDAAITASGIVPAAKGWLAAMKFLKQPHFTDGCVVAPGAGVPKAAAALVGRSLSQPQVTLSAGDAAPLDSVLGNGWALLHFPAGTGASFEVRRLNTGPVNEWNDDGGSPLARQGTTAVTDASGAFSAVAGSGVTLVVRPDRYVAAATTPETERTALDALAAYVPELARLQNAEAGTSAAP